MFDPNCCVIPPQLALEHELLQSHWDVIGVSTTGMTLRYDLELAYIARRLVPGALIVAGGMEATFRPELMFELGPFDLVVLGEGERPLTEIVRRLRAGEPLDELAGHRREVNGTIVKRNQRALSREELRAAIFNIPYARMPYSAYWSRLEEAYRVGSAAEQGRARGAPRGDPLSAADHAQLLPDGLHLLLRDQLPARIAGSCRRGRPPRG